MSERRLFRSLLALFAFLIVIGMAVLLFTNSKPNPVDVLRDSGTFRIGYADEYPYAFVDNSQRVRGESAESAREIAKRLGFKQIQWIEMPFEQLIPNLQARHIDMIAAGMVITPARQQHVSFSLPTLQFDSGLLVHAANPKFLRPSDIENQRSDITLAVIDQSFEQLKLNQHVGAKLSVVTDLTQALDALDTEAVDGIVVSLPTLRVIAESYPDDYLLLTLSSNQVPSFITNAVAFAFHPDDGDLLAAWNEQVQQWVGTESHLQLITAYGFSPMDTPHPTPR